MNRNRFLTLGASSMLAMPAILHMPLNANVLTGLIPDLYAALDIVSRELVGMIPAVNRAPGVERAAVGQSVRYNIAQAQAAYDIQPAMQIPEPPDNTLSSGVMTISKARAVPFGFTGEEQRALNTGVGYNTIRAGIIAQGLRTLTNEIERDLTSLAIFASRAYGTPGTTPFASGLGDMAQVRRILDDNGAPLSGRALVINTAAGANMRTNQNLIRANEAGTTMTLRQGELLDIHGLSVHESAGVIDFVKGTGAGATTNAAGYGIGATTITLASAGTGIIKPGDTVQFAGDVNKYVVETGNANVAAGGTIKISAPGLRVAIPAAATAITLGNSASYNIAFADGAIHLVTRPPAIPDENDAATDSMMIEDPRSGLTFEIRVYAGYRKVRYEIGLAWGFAAVKREHIALLLG